MNYSHTPPLENDHIRLEPLSDSHLPDLVQAVRDGELWRAWYATTPSPETMAAAVEHRLELHAAGASAPWAVVDPASGAAVGMSSFINLDEANRRLEIGSTWLAASVQGRGMNAAMKLLMLGRAFEDLGCIAVEFRTHWHNRQSRAAIAKLGAKQEGVLRNHKILPNGSIRDTVVFSIIESEWQTVKLGLTERLRPAGRA